MSDLKPLPPPKPASVYDDGNIPEIDFPHPSNAIPHVPSEFGNDVPDPGKDDRPRKDGPGGN